MSSAFISTEKTARNTRRGVRARVTVSSLHLLQQTADRAG